MYANLNNLSKATDLGFSKQIILDWFPVVCEAIKNEQELCLAGKLTGERAVYAKYFNVLNPEKITMIGLNELFNEILKLIQIKKDDDSEFVNFKESNYKYFIVSQMMMSKIGKSINSQIIYEKEIRLLRTKMSQNLKKNYNEEEKEGKNVINEIKKLNNSIKNSKVEKFFSFLKLNF